jgi:Na+/melibiose symporter-like transporter
LTDVKFNKAHCAPKTVDTRDHTGAAGTPCWLTQYYLQDTLHAKDAQWGQWNAIFSAYFIPTFLVFGVLCRKFPLKTLLFWGTVVAIPQTLPLLFIHSVSRSDIASCFSTSAVAATARPARAMMTQHRR